MTKNINLKYKRERYVMSLLSDKIIPIAFSGGNWQHGLEDGQSEEMIVQVKSTRTNGIRIVFDMVIDLLKHKKHTQVPVLMLDFASPASTRTGFFQFPEEIWVAIRLADFKQYALPSIEQTVTSVEKGGDCPSHTKGVREYTQEATTE